MKNMKKMYAGVAALGLAGLASSANAQTFGALVDFTDVNADVVLIGTAVIALCLLVKGLQIAVRLLKRA